MNPQTHKLFLLDGLLGTVPSVRPSTTGFHRCCDRHSRDLFVLCGNRPLHHLQSSVPNVDSCVMVSVMVRTTAGTSPLSIRKGKLLIQCTAYMAHLTGRIPLINFDKDFSAIPEFILQHVAEHPKTVIVGGLAQPQRGSHIAQVDVFRENSVVPLGYRGTQLLAEVSALIGYLLMEKLDLVFLLFIVFRAILHAGQLSLFFSQFSFGSTIKARVVGYIAVTIDIKVVGGIIQTYRAFYFNRNDDIFKFEKYGDEILPTLCSLNGSRFDMPTILWQTVFANSHITSFGKMNMISTDVQCLRF